jgi:DNA polymerase-3 subunit alpha
LLSGGEVTGIFQVESGGMRRVLTSMKPSEFDHIVAVLALYRPGPMDFIDDYVAGLQGRKKPEYAHPALEPILGETFGVCVYQEQIIRILTDIAGYLPGDADLVRKAVGKKNREALIRHREGFVKGAQSQSGLDKAAADKIFDAFEDFARYGFNKAHSADYAVITVQTAYLKAHYPVEYMTALLTVERGNVEKVGLLIAEARRLGIEVLPPNVNHSGIDFTIEDEPEEVKGPAIRYGLGAVKNVGLGPVGAIIEVREAGGKFTDVDDFCQRVDLRLVNRRALECLIKAGAFSPLGRRAPLLAVVDRMMSISQQAHAARQQITMFDLPGFAEAARLAGDLPDVDDIPRKEMLAWEKDLIGAYVSDHPLSRVWGDLEKSITALTGDVNEAMSEQSVIVAGMVNHVRQIMTKKNNPMAFAQLEDLQGTIEVVIFPSVWETTKELWEPDRILIVGGRVSLRGREPSIIAETVTNQVTVVKAVDSQGPAQSAVGPVHVHVTVGRSSELEEVIKRLGQLYDVMQKYEGQDRFSLYVENGGQGQILISFPNDTTKHCAELAQELQKLVSGGAIRVVPLGQNGVQR